MEYIACNFHKHNPATHFYYNNKTNMFLCGSHNIFSTINLNIAQLQNKMKQVQEFFNQFLKITIQQINQLKDTIFKNLVAYQEFLEKLHQIDHKNQQKPHILLQTLINQFTMDMNTLQLKLYIFDNKQVMRQRLSSKLTSNINSKFGKKKYQKLQTTRHETECSELQKKQNISTITTLRGENEIFTNSNMETIIINDFQKNLKNKSIDQIISN